MPPTASILEDRGRAGARDRDRAMHNTLPRGGYSGPALTSASPPGRWQHCAGPPRLPDRGTRLTSARRGRTVGCPRKWAGQRGRRGWNGPRWAWLGSGSARIAHARAEFLLYSGFLHVLPVIFIRNKTMNRSVHSVVTKVCFCPWNFVKKSIVNISYF